MSTHDLRGAITEQAKPMSRRDVWLTIALAVAEGLPEPHNMSLHDGIASMSLDSPTQVTAWGSWLGVGRADEPHWMPKLGLWHYGWHTSRSGWAWQIRADVPDAPGTFPPSPLAEQLVAALTVPSGVDGTSIGTRHREGS